MSRSFSFARTLRLPLAKLPRTRRRAKPRANQYEMLEHRYLLAPVAANDSYTMNGNTALSVAAPGVQANDTPDPTLMMTSNLVTGPSHGSLTLNGNGSFSYTPVTNYTGTDAFTYNDSDMAGVSNTATVTITINNPNQPVAVNDSYSVLHDRTNSISAASGVLANDTDPNHLPSISIPAVT